MESLHGCGPAPAASFEEIKARAEKTLCRTYSRYPVGVRAARGSRIWDFDGREYIDLLAGIAVTGVGHAHPQVNAAMLRQMEKLTHVSNLFYQEEQVLLAEKLLASNHCSKVFFCNSGAEANEAAIKLARRFQRKVRGEDRYEIITLSSCFHGRTLGALAATGQARLQDGFAPFPPGFLQVEAENMEALRAAVSPACAAIMLEVVQGEGGVRPLSRDYVRAVEDLCQERGLLFIIDEVQAGMGRSGHWWAFQHYGVKPHIFTSAKALANGLPMGAMLCTEETAQGFDYGSHATTFGGNALCSAAALAVLEVMEKERLPERAARLGLWAKHRFEGIAAALPGSIREVRGLGLFLGIELAAPGKDLWEALLRKGFILNLTQERVLRLLPALNIAEEDLEAFALALEESLAERK
ncbi:MAG: aspartate aminotransferase family protein [Deltaproteobacteria bacterium]|jgi:acetylornithine aminotransferase|nr:aspartate aminotransferase family protein [Deltaproteobacteria bacterium]